MKTGSITELASIMNAGISQAGMPSSGKTAAGESFSQIMSQAEGSRRDSNADVISVNNTSDGDRSSKGRLADSPNENGRSAADKVAKTADNSGKKDVDNLDRNELEEMVGDNNAGVINQIEEELGVSEDEILEAMETLGLTMLDLLDPSKVQMLYTELSDAADVSAILTDEGLYDGLKEVLEEVSVLTDSVMEEFGITKDQLDAALEGISEENGPVIIDDNQDDARAMISTGNEASQALDDEVGGILDDIPVSAGESYQYDKDDKGESSTAEENFFGQSSMQNNTVENTQVDEIENSYGSDSNVSAQDISRQLVEQIKLKAAADTTTLEMELNPESLGKVGLVIESKNGAITAQFSAANEFVKAAIEGQMTILQQQLEEQGVKVEAVEVTLASHQFGQSLEQNNPGEEQQQEAAERLQKAGMRRRMQINLLNSEDDQEELSEEEVINRDMMKRNGNSVDYMV